MQTVKTKTSTTKTTTKTVKPKDCPYCKSQLTATEKDFFPCTCSFQACGNCYEDLLNNKGICPSCHKPFRLPRIKPTHNSKKEELPKADPDKVNKEKKKTTTITTVVTTVSSRNGHSSHTTVTTTKPEPKVQLPKMSFAELSKLRIIQRNLVYVIGLAPQIAKPEVLEKYEYFGQYGKISKIVVNKGNAYNATSGSGPSFSAYITFVRELEAAVAIMAADQFTLYDRTLRTSYGTTKYCTFLLKGQSCPNPDCLYLHSCENKEELLIKDENMSNREIFMDQQKLTLDFIEKHFDEVVKRSAQESTTKSILPSISTVQAKAKRLIDQRAKEHPIDKTNHKENSATKKPTSASKTSQKDNESLHSSMSPAKSSSQQESRTEGLSENALHSHRSTSSNWSTTDINQKKEQLTDHIEDQCPKSATKAETDTLRSEASVSRKDSELNEKTCTESLRMRSSLNDLVDLDLLSNKDGKESEDEGFKDDFDKTIYERVMAPIYLRKTSRFSCTQDDGTEDEEALTAESTAKNSENEEFSIISKSISEFVTEKNEEKEPSETSLSGSESKDRNDSILSMNKGPQVETNPTPNNEAKSEAKPSNNSTNPLKDHNITEAPILNGATLDKSSGKTASISSATGTAVNKVLNDVKRMSQKGGNASHSVNKTAHNNNWENMSNGVTTIGKHSVNKSAEYNNTNTTSKHTDSAKYPNIMNIHTRSSNQSKINAQKW